MWTNRIDRRRTEADKYIPVASYPTSVCSPPYVDMWRGSESDGEDAQQGLLGALSDTGGHSTLQGGMSGIGELLAVSCGHVSTSIEICHHINVTCPKLLTSSFFAGGLLVVPAMQSPTPSGCSYLRLAVFACLEQDPSWPAHYSGLQNPPKYSSHL